MKDRYAIQYWAECRTCGEMTNLVSPCCNAKILWETLQAYRQEPEVLEDEVAVEEFLRRA